MKMLPVMKRCYTEAKEGSPIDGGQDVAVVFFSLAAIVLSYSPSGLCAQTFVTGDRYRMIVTTCICINP